MGIVLPQLLHPLYPVRLKITAIKAGIKKLVKQKCSEDFFINWYGAYYIDPKHLVIWVCVKTDRQKLLLQNDERLNTAIRGLLREYDYPAEARPFVHIGYESQETVERESAGNWYHHFK